MHTLLNSPRHENPTIPALSPQLANHLQIAPLIAIGALDSEKRPWTTLWGSGYKAFARPIAQGIVGIRTPVTGQHDPVVESLFGKEATGEIVREEGEGRMVSGLTIDLDTRKRVKMFGRMVAGALGTKEDEIMGHQEHIAEVQMVLKIEQSLGNCPKYLNKRTIVPAVARPELISDSPKLPQRALDLISKSDLFFISSSQHDNDMDTNHRGGPQGFLRVVSNEESGAVICYPEYSGNRLYQTLGNLFVNPLAGICIPDFETGDMLYLTGRTDILIGKKAADVLPRSNLAVKVTITSARFVSNALPFRGLEGERSPYNPAVRYLTSERKPPASEEKAMQAATLLSQTKLTPNVSVFKFALENAAEYRAGQYVTLDLSSHMDMGYSHMRDDDPQSINDDFVRTFTVSSPPYSPGERLRNDEFEITVRKVGPATGFLFRHLGKESTERGMHELEVNVKGFGGEFEVQQEDGETIGFIAAGVGITPILPSLATLDFARLKLFWSIREDDVGLISEVLKQHPRLKHGLYVFITNVKEASPAIDDLKKKGAAVHLRRMHKTDLECSGKVNKYYLCTPVPMRKQLQEWLNGKELIFEDFSF